LPSSPKLAFSRLNPRSPDNALSFGVAWRFSYSNQQLILDCARRYEEPEGELESHAVRLDFDRRLMLQFRGFVVTSDAGLLAYRELDDAIGLTMMASDVLADARTGKDGRHALGRAVPTVGIWSPCGGMGLSICRSIIEAHGGRLWASPNVPRCAIFQFTLVEHLAVQRLLGRMVTKE
jgi:hypothetical protein